MNNKTAVRLRLATLFALLLVLMLTSFASADESGAVPSQAAPTATPVVTFPIYIQAEGPGPIVPGTVDPITGQNNFMAGSILSSYDAGGGMMESNWSVNTRMGVVPWDPATRTCTYVASYPGTQANQAWVEFVFYAPHRGEYYVWANTQAPNNRSDLFHVQLDNQAPFVFRAKLLHWVWAPINYGNGGRWMLSPGRHTIRFYGIEQGGRIDAIAISNNYLHDIKVMQVNMGAASPSCYGGPRTDFVRPQMPDDPMP
jgi:hypothetical protein